jgi:hypothetical protein
MGVVIDSSMLVLAALAATVLFLMIAFLSPVGAYQLATELWNYKV